MKLPVSLGIKPALITAAVLLLVIAGMGVKLALVSSARDVAVADLSTRTTERDAWKGKAEGCTAANEAYDAAFDKMAVEQAARDQQAAEAAKRAAAAVAAAQAEADRAEAQRDSYARKFAARTKNCAQALQTMQAACPALEGF